MQFLFKIAFPKMTLKEMGPLLRVSVHAWKLERTVIMYTPYLKFSCKHKEL